MYSWNNSDDRVAIVQMNAELRHAQMDLLSAECATERLRARFSVKDLAHYGERGVLRKAIGAAIALSEYYLSIRSEMPPDTLPLSETQTEDAVHRVAAYLKSQREYYFHKGVPLKETQKALLRPYFSAVLLDGVRTVELHGHRLPAAPFYPEARALGIERLPELTHMASLTFWDVIVFNDLIVERSLFHGLVHAVQFQILGLDGYCDRFVRAFLRTRAHYNVPLEAHAFALESKFVIDPDKAFSVEEHVRLWLREGRYE